MSKNRLIEEYKGFYIFRVDDRLIVSKNKDYSNHIEDLNIKIPHPTDISERKTLDLVKGGIKNYLSNQKE